MATAFIFPGQGSQYVGMLDDFARHPQVAAALDEISEALSDDIRSLCAAGGDEARLNDTSYTQPALLGMSVGLFSAWFAEGGIRPAVLAGHSLGEYSALVCGRAMELADAARLVRTRADAMKAAVPEGRGFAMCAVLGLPPKKVSEVCSRHEGVYAVNFNSPIQTVVAGTEDGIEAAAAELSEEGSKRIVRLAVSVPSHCEWMRAALEPLKAKLADMSISVPEIPVLQNATLSYADSPDAIRDALAAQLVQPVDWVGAVMALYKKADSFVECGPGQVLSGLGRRIAKGAEFAAMGDSSGLRKLALA